MKNKKKKINQGKISLIMYLLFIISFLKVQNVGAYGNDGKFVSFPLLFDENNKFLRMTNNYLFFSGLNGPIVSLQYLFIAWIVFLVVS